MFEIHTDKRPAGTRVQGHSGEPARVHRRASLGEEYPRVSTLALSIYKYIYQNANECTQMALCDYRSSSDPLSWRTILGHAGLHAQLPLCATSHPDAHSKRTLPAFDTSVSQHQRLSPQIIQPRLGHLHHSDRTAVLHDQRRDDDGEHQRDGPRTSMARLEVALVELNRRRIRK